MSKVSDFYQRTHSSLDMRTGEAGEGPELIVSRVVSHHCSGAAPASKITGGKIEIK